MKKIAGPILDGLVSLAVPVILSVVSILVLLSPIFTNLEYRRPGFPEDRYGFTTAERVEFGNLTRRYLVTRQSLDGLRALEFPSGDALYQERELTHLEDVKIVLQGVLRVCAAAVVVVVLAGIFSRMNERLSAYWRAISRGGRLTAILLVAILLLTLVSFQALFTNFHLIFFKGDSWLFSYSDTLIRLFPIRFWQDIFLVFGALTLGAGIYLGWFLPRTWQGREQA
jgi:integral membrane protein (TIGR01906 family)